MHLTILYCRSVLAETSSSSTRLASRTPPCQGEPSLHCSSGPLKKASVDGTGRALGQTEPASRHAISEQCPLRGVDAPPTNGSGNMGNLWQARGRPLRLRRVEDDSHCQTYFSKDRDVLAHDWPNLLLYAFSPIALIPQDFYFIFFSWLLGRMEFLL